MRGFVGLGLLGVACTAAGGDPVEAARGGAPATASKPLPLTLGDFALAVVPGALTGSRSLQLEMTARLNESLDASMVVRAKPVCRRGAKLVTDMQPIDLVEIKNMDAYAIGDSPRLRGLLFADVWTADMAGCQIDFQLASRVRTGATALTTICWKDGAVTTGACDPPPAPAGAPSASEPISVAEVGAAPEADNTLAVTVELDIHGDAHEDSFFVKSVCPVDGVALVDLRELRNHQSPFRFLAGESLRRAARMYWPEGFGVAGPLDGCELTVGRWPGRQLEAPIELARACWKGGATTKGACAPTTVPPPPATPIGAKSVKLSSVLIAPRPFADFVLLDLRADVTIVEPVTWDSNLDEVKIKCNGPAGVQEDTTYVGPANRSMERTFDSAGLHSLAPGETSRLGGEGFNMRQMKAVPETCEVTFTASVLEGKPFELARFCMRNAEVKPGACPEEQERKRR
ncbi:hypothetical protein [Nannocystis sp. SCPEA4]|uniref:hypothetical protein n=1 Tax=Nannocystis sp. SCPEA4 TaxID=2996787 RepID=UPI00226DEED9|nr:hypothetical protein [Nannocystis sp. SCPEA4]MCY1058068.1 hypothetical protein [Nannocystis sp. SCPEA4]